MFLEYPKWLAEGVIVQSPEEEKAWREKNSSEETSDSTAESTDEAPAPAQEAKPKRRQKEKPNA